MPNKKIDKKQIRIDFNNFISNCSRFHSDESQQTIMKAFDMAERAFQSIKKNSGEYYIEHSVEVAKIVAYEIGLGVKAITAALLHDVLDETDLQIDEVEKCFGNKTASILKGLTKIREVIDSQDVVQAEAFRRVLLTLSDDIRVIFIKIADRLHHMRTLDLYSPRIQTKTVNESLRVYLPLAHRLGLYNIKTELEDLSLKYTHKDIYDDINSKIIGSKKERTQLITNFSLPIITELDKRGFDFEITGRIKSVYSIWQKMQKKNIDFKEVYDVFAIRIVFKPGSQEKEFDECWEILNVIESMDNRQIKQDRTRDWLKRPKPNGYSALHLTVLYKQTYWIEVQIRSKRMNDIAELGFASHWKYKGIEDKESDLDLWIRDIKEKLNSSDENSQDFFDSFNMDVFSSEILVFSSKGKLVNLPKNATVLDFAFETNPQTAFHCIGAKIGRNLVSRNYILNSGDIVEILSSDKEEPKPEWTFIVKTPKAYKILNKYFALKRVKQVDKGKQILKDILIANHIEIDDNTYKRILKNFDLHNKDELFQKIADNEINNNELLGVLKKKSTEQLVKYWKLEFNDYDELKKLKRVNPTMDETKSYTFADTAKCCYPLPGDKVVALQMPDGRLILHKNNCIELNNETNNNTKKLVDVTWTNKGILSYLYRIKLNGIDRFGVINQLSTILSKEFNVNIKSFYFDSDNDSFSVIIDIYVANESIVNEIIKRLESINTFTVQIARDFKIIPNAN